METVEKLGGNQYLVTAEGRTVKFDLDGVCFGLGGGEEYTREEYIELDENPAHAEALMNYLHI